MVKLNKGLQTELHTMLRHTRLLKNYDLQLSEENVDVCESVFVAIGGIDYYHEPTVQDTFPRRHHFQTLHSPLNFLNMTICA